MYRHFFKPCFDIITACLGLIILSPLFVALTLLLIITNHGRPFFRQTRPGKDGKPFRIIKFKTMTDQTDAAGQLLPDHMRLTGLGRFIRKTSLDEIPQLLNVLKGDLSLIGPRPLLMEYLPLYSDQQMRRHNVKPGITGWAQINGRNTISWQKKFELDIHYVDNVSLLLDVKILFLTLINVIKRQDVNQSETITMPKFNGKN